MDGDKDILVEISNLYVNFYTYQGVVKAIDGVDLAIRKGETLGLVGETGCGKSVTASAIMKLILMPPGKIENGSIYFMEPPEVRSKRLEFERKVQEWYAAMPEKEKRRIVAQHGTRFTGYKKRVKALTKKEKESLEVPFEIPEKAVLLHMASMAKKVRKEDRTSLDALRKTYDLIPKKNEYMQMIRGKWVSMIFQEPTSALNPVFTAGDQIAEVILLHRKAEMAARALVRVNEELKLMKGSDRTRDVKLAAEWYTKLPEAEKKRVVATGYGKRSRTIAEIEKTKAPVKIPDNILKIRLKHKRRPTIYEVAPDKILPGQVVEKEPPTVFRCTICDGVVDELDTNCEHCRTAFYGPLRWVIRRPILETYKRVFENIHKNPKTKNPIIARIPLLKRFMNELHEEALREAVQMLKTVRIPDPKGVARRFPFELSGGMQQRVMIAMALACNPRLLIADEPTTALDVTIQGQILKLMRDLKQEYGSSILLITHNLGVVAEMCDRVGVMYAGSMAEVGPARSIFKSPLHPYTTGLMKAVPSIQMSAERLYTIRGSVPNLIFPPSGCRFHPRCDYAKEYCKQVKPLLTEIEPGHGVSCHMVAKAEGYVNG